MTYTKIVGNDIKPRSSRNYGRTVIQLDNPAIEDCILTQVHCHTTGAGSGKVKIFRDDGTNFVMVAEVAITNVEGDNAHNVSLPVKKGDYIAYYFSSGQSHGIPNCDNTGSTAYINGDVTTAAAKTGFYFRSQSSDIHAGYTEAVPPTISDISWSPKGDFVAVSAGASLVGATTELKVVATSPEAFADDPPIEEGEAFLEIIDNEGVSQSTFVVKEYDHFRFDNKEWWALNIVCGPECDLITIADEVAEALKTPKIGDEIQFTCNIDWHGIDPDKVEWYYAKPPNECFDEETAAGLWTRFATTQLPVHTFEVEDDHEIVFLKVVAKNANGDIDELGNTCRPVFNLWKPPEPAFMESWLIAPFMAYILPGLAEKFEYISDLVFDGVPESSSGGFSLLWSPVEFVQWIAVELAALAEDILNIVFGALESESTSGYSIFWSAADFVQWIYRSVAAMFEAILDLVFKD